MICEAITALGGAPGSAEEPVQVRAQHGAGVIEGKERVKADLFELPLTCDAASATFHSRVAGFGKMTL